MPTQVDVLPDAEAVVGVHLRSQNLPTILQRVYSEIPKDPAYPLVKHARVGGTPVVRQRLDAADIQFDVYALSKSQASLAARQVRAAMFLLEGSTVTTSQGDAFVTGVEDVIGLTWMPDASNIVTPRYIFSVRLYLHAMP